MSWWKAWTRDLLLSQWSRSLSNVWVRSVGAKGVHTYIHTYVHVCSVCIADAAVFCSGPLLRNHDQLTTMWLWVFSWTQPMPSLSFTEGLQLTPMRCVCVHVCVRVCVPSMSLIPCSDFSVYTVQWMCFTASIAAIAQSACHNHEFGKLPNDLYDITHQMLIGQCLDPTD